MALSKPSEGAGLAAAVAFLVGTTGGYGINEVIRSDRETGLEHEVARLKDEVSQRTNADVPSDEEASAALACAIRTVDAHFGMQTASVCAGCDLLRHYDNNRGIICRCYPTRCALLC